MSDIIKNIIITILYFGITIAFLSSVGIWLPLWIDDYNIGRISDATYQALASNILTYALSLYIVSTIDRIIHLIWKTGKYTNHTIEFLLIVAISLFVVFIVYKSVKLNRHEEISNSIKWAIYLALIAWGTWWYVRLQATKGNNFSPIGGEV